MSNTFEIKKHDQFDLKTTKSMVPMYRYFNVPPVNTLTVQQASESKSTFQINSNLCFNPGKSYLEFDVDIPLDANDITYLHTGFPALIKAIQVRSPDSILCEISNFPQYVKLVKPVTTSREEWEQTPAIYDDGLGGKLIGHYDERGPSQVSENTDYPSRQLAYDGSLEYSEGPTSVQSYAASGMQHFAGTGAVNVNFATTFQIPLEDIPHFAMGINKDLFLGKRIDLSVTWSPSTEIGFKADDAKSALTNVAALAVTHTVSNPRLRLAVQDNPAICEGLKNRWQNGYQMVVPHITEFFDTSANTASISRTLKYNESAGRSILRVYSGLLRTSGANIRYINNNSDATYKVTGARSWLNGSPLQDEKLTDYQEFLRNPTYKGCIITNPKHFAQHYVKVDDFSGMTGVELAKNPSVDSGIPTTPEMDYTIEFTRGSSTTNMTLHVFAIGTKVLTVNPGMVAVI